jgi:hypothetical protein
MAQAALTYASVRCYCEQDSLLRRWAGNTAVHDDQYRVVRNRLTSCLLFHTTCTCPQHDSCITHNALKTGKSTQHDNNIAAQCKPSCADNIHEPVAVCFIQHLSQRHSSNERGTYIYNPRSNKPAPAVLRAMACMHGEDVQSEKHAWHVTATCCFMCHYLAASITATHGCPYEQAKDLLYKNHALLLVYVPLSRLPPIEPDCTTCFATALPYCTCCGQRQ